ncbi:MAG TPA: mannonate dehydratase [Solibacterales bacterium]|nr:mannonate dehydratase [Bryobacterales bacterium]
MIQIAELFDPGDQHKMRIAAQSGVTHAIARLAPVLADVPRDRFPAVIASVKRELEDAGLLFAGVESHPVPAEKIKLGLPGRDEEIENYLAVMRALAAEGVTLLCYNWMAGLGWYRTSTAVPERAGALVSEFDWSTAEREGPTPWGIVTEEQLWANLAYFLAAVLPLADQLGLRMAIHPDDPPVSPLRGIARILTTAGAFRRVLSLHNGPSNGITFCQANFRLMGEDTAVLVREWCAAQRIFFVHLRDIVGTREHFRETFHDNGPGNLALDLKVYQDSGFTGPMRPDHAPTLDGESNAKPGYAIAGKILAVGYLKGAMDALGIPYYGGRP